MNLRMPYPLLTSHGRHTGSAVVVPHTRTLEARVGDTSKGSTSDEQVGVGTRQDVGHHRARRSTGHEDLILGNAPVLDGIPHDGGNGERITTAVVCKSFSAVDIPAASRVGSVGVDDHEALVRVGKVGVVGAGKVCLGGTGAVMHGDDKGWVGYEACGLVRVHFDVGGVAAKVGDLNQLVLGGESAHGANGEGDEGEHAGEHLVLNGFGMFRVEKRVLIGPRSVDVEKAKTTAAALPRNIPSFWYFKRPARRVSLNFAVDYLLDKYFQCKSTI